MAYFIRRSGGECTVIELHPDNREKVIASGMAIGEAEDLRASKIEAMRSTKSASPVDTGPAPRRRMKHGVSLRSHSNNAVRTKGEGQDSQVAVSRTLTMIILTMLISGYFQAFELFSLCS
jgi:hypothetical protein